MATYVEIHDAATNADHVLRAQVTVAIQHAAAAIVLEAPGVPNHGARLNWARRARRDPTGVAEQIMWRALEAAGNATLTTIPDATVQTVITDLVNEFALG